MNWLPTKWVWVFPGKGPALRGLGTWPMRDVSGRVPGFTDHCSIASGGRTTVPGAYLLTHGSQIVNMRLIIAIVKTTEVVKLSRNMC